MTTHVRSYIFRVKL